MFPDPVYDSSRDSTPVLLVAPRASRHDANESTVITLGDSSKLPPYTQDVELGLTSYSSAVDVDRAETVQTVQTQLFW